VSLGTGEAGDFLEIVYQNVQPQFGSAADEASATKATKLAMLLKVGIYAFGDLATQFAERFRLRGFHKRTMGFDQFLMLAATNTAAFRLACRARRPHRTNPTVLGRTHVTAMHFSAASGSLGLTTTFFRGRRSLGLLCWLASSNVSR